MMTLEEHHERLAHAARDAVEHLQRDGHVLDGLVHELRELLATPHADAECADKLLRDACLTLAEDLAALLAPVEAALAQPGGEVEFSARAAPCAAMRARLALVAAALAETKRTRSAIWTAALTQPAAHEGDGVKRAVGWFLTLPDAMRHLARPEVWRPGEVLAVIEQVASGDCGCFGGPRWFRAEVDSATGRRKLHLLEGSTGAFRLVGFVMG